MPFVFETEASIITKIAAPVITTKSCPPAQVVVPYSLQFTATGGVPPYTWSSSGTGFGYTMNSSGLLTGSSNQVAQFTLVVTVTDQLGNSSKTGYPFFVQDSGPTITTPPNLPGATVGVAYSTQLAASGGSPPYTWAIQSDTPDSGAWLSINPTTGVLSGTPGTAETETVTVVATDNNSVPSAPTQFTLVVSGGGPPAAFDKYISPTGDDSNPGTFASPWSITALGTTANRTTSACKWTTYGGATGLRVGIMPGKYTQGQNTVSGVTTVTQLYALAEAGATTVLVVNGSQSATNPVYIAGCDANGNEWPGTAAPLAEISIGYNGNIPPDWESNVIGNSEVNLPFRPPVVGNVVLSALKFSHWGGWAFVLGDNASSSSTGMVVKNCWLTNGSIFHNDNCGGGQFNGCPGFQFFNNLLDKTYASNTIFQGHAMGYISGTSLVITQIVSGQLWYAGTAQNMQVFNGSPTNSAAKNAAAGTIGPNTLPTGLTADITANAAGTYTLSSAPGNIGSASAPVDLYLSLPSSSTKWGAYALIVYNTNATTGAAGAPGIVQQNTFLEHNLLDFKTHPQNFQISYNIFSSAENGNSGTTPITPPVTLNLQPVAGSTGNFVHHNVFIGGLFLYDAAAPVGNAGAYSCYNNTFYFPAGYNMAGGDVANATYEQNITSGSNTGSSLDYNNLVWSDMASPLSGYCLVVAPTLNANRDHNCYISGTLPFITQIDGTPISLPTYQSTYSQETGSILLTSSPFKVTPQPGGVASSYAVNPSSPAATAGRNGAMTGAVDGSGQLGCTFGGQIVVTTQVLANATVTVAYSQQLAASGGSNTFNWTLVSAAPDWEDWISLSASGQLTGTPSMVENASTGGPMQITVIATDAVSGIQSAPTTFSITVNPF